MNLYGNSSYNSLGSPIARDKRGTLSALYGGEIPAYDPSQSTPITDVTDAGASQVAPVPSAQKVGSSEGWLSKLLASANTDETPEEKAAREKAVAAGDVPANPSGERALKMKQMSENFTNYAREMKNQAIARESVDKGRQFDAAASGPAMLSMIQSISKRDQENRFRTNGLSAMAGI